MMVWRGIWELCNYNCSRKTYDLKEIIDNEQQQQIQKKRSDLLPEVDGGGGRVGGRGSKGQNFQ